MSQFDLRELELSRQKLLQHPIYKAIDSPEKVRIFMQHHVFAVWDFMSLLKRLQNDLTCTSVPWIPKPEPTFSRFVNEIVLGEESDEDGEGGYNSHFTLYLLAMDESEADTGPINRFISDIQNGKSPFEAVEAADVSDSVRKFVRSTLDVAMHAGTHEVSSAFFFGREDIIPAMFQSLISELREKGQSSKKLEYYLQRHIDLDGDEHGPLAEKLLTRLCGDDPKKQQEAVETAKKAILSRIELWDGVLAEISVTS